MPLTSAELHRYARHLNLPDFTAEHQLRLQAARVLVIGAGGLGSPALQYLAAAGVGQIGIADPDMVSLSNLQRQVLYATEDIGRPKALVAAQRIQALNPHVQVDVFQEWVSMENVRTLIRSYDLVLDGSDNFPTRYLVNDACVLERKTLVHAAVSQFEGQVAVFNYQFPDGRVGVNYRDLFPTPPPEDLIPNCADGGVLGVLPGLIGSLQANEAIKLISEMGEPLIDQLFIFNALDLSNYRIRIPKNPSVNIEKLQQYEAFCAPAPDISPTQRLSPETLKKWQTQQVRHELVDIREQYERELFHIGGTWAPKAEALAQLKQLPKETAIVLYCRSGKRCIPLLQQLQKAGYSNTYLLEGGLQAWIRYFELAVELP